MGGQAQRKDVERQVQAIPQNRKGRMCAKSLLAATDELQGETAKALNDLARHQMIHRILKDILIDLTVCEIEGWNKLEYINLLSNEIERIKRGNK